MKDGPDAAAKPRRLFFALWPDDATRAALADWGRRIHEVAGGRPTRAESIHQTLAFLGDCEPARVPDAAAAAGRVQRRGFELVLDRAGLWPHNRIAWAGATAVPPELDALVTELRTALAAAGVGFDAKPFALHITLVRKARPGAALPALDPIRWRVAEFVLVRSVPRAGGSDYAIQRCWG
ncbi:MAG: RNA 2',3'-cyclic phosphodiesterase [Burkholderiales bacterium]